MSGISAMIWSKEEILEISIIILGLSWIAVKKWVPLEEWTLKNTVKLNKEGLRQWLIIVAGLAFFIGSPVVFIMLLAIVGEEANNGVINVLLALMAAQVFYSRIMREDSVIVKNAVYKRGGLSSNEYNVWIFTMLWTGLIIAVSIIGVGAEAFFLTFFVSIEGLTQFKMRIQNENRIIKEKYGSAAVKGVSLQNIKMAERIIDKQVEDKTKVRYSEYRFYF